MATAYSTLLQLALPVQGELSGTWGDVVNDNITNMIEEAIAGQATMDVWVANSHTLTTANGTTAQARNAILKLTDTTTDLSGTGTLIVPTRTKLYVVNNGTGQTITVKTSAGSGIAVLDGNTSFVYCDGTNVVEASNAIAGSGVFGTMTVAGGSITDTSGAISLGNENLTTTGTLASGALTVTGLITGGDLTLNAANPEILGGDTNGIMYIAPGADNAKGGNILLYGDTHATKANDIELRATAGVELQYDDSASKFDFQANAIDTTGAVTFSGGGALTGTWTDLGTVSTVDINGGTLDGTTIGAASAAAVTATTITGSGVLSIDDTTDSSSTTTGSIHTDGGLGVAKALFVGKASTIETSASGQTANAMADELHLSSSGNTGMTISAGTSSTASILFSDAGDNAIGRIIYDHAQNDLSFGVAGATDKLLIATSVSTFSTALSVDDTTDSSSTTTGSIHTDGGLGVAKASFFGGAMDISPSSGVALTLDQDNNAKGLVIDTEATSQTALEIASVQTTNSVMTIVNAGQQTSGALLYLAHTHASTSVAGIYTENAGTGNGIFIDQEGNGIALNIDSEATSAVNLQLDSINTSGNILQVVNVGNHAAAGAGAIVAQQGHASTTASVIVAQQLGTGNGIFINQDGDGIALNIDSEAPTASSITINSPTNAFLIGAVNAHGSTPYGVSVSYSVAAPNNTSSLFLNCADTGGAKMTVRSNGGIANVQSNDADLSDISVKEDITPLGSMWDTFKAIEIVDFRYINQTNDNLNIGIIAQQVQKVEPRFVDDSGFEQGDGLLTVFNKDMYFGAMRVTQEAMARIESLEAEIEQLK